MNAPYMVRSTGPGEADVVDRETGERATRRSAVDRWAAALVSAVRRLHSRREFSGDGYGWSVCAECRQTWPCATEQAVLRALSDEEDALRG